MDYEKMYKEALERVRRLHDRMLVLSSTDALVASAELEFIFPELKESEDERIRKLLIWQVYRNIEDETNDLAGSVYDGIKGHDPDLEESIEDWKKCLAYLEKQKESLPISETCKENANSFADGIIEVRSFQRGMEEGRRLEKQKEQKPVSFSCSHENGKPAEWAELRTEFNINEAFEDGKKEVIDHPDKYGLTKQKPVESIEGGALTHLGNED